MTIDKFGRSLKSTTKDIKGPKGDGFNLTHDGNFDISNKRLTNIGDPIGGHDAVTKSYCDQHFLSLEKDSINILGKRLRNVAKPEQDTDAVNLGEIKRLCLRSEGTYYNADNKTITNLIDPISPNDAATKKYVDKVKSEYINKNSTMIAKQQTDINSIKERTAKCESLIANNKDYHDKNLKKLGIALYNNINKKNQGRSVISEGDDISWDDFFQLFKGGIEGEEDEGEFVEIPSGYGILMTEGEVEDLHI